MTAPPPPVPQVTDFAFHNAGQIDCQHKDKETQPIPLSRSSTRKSAREPQSPRKSPRHYKHHEPTSKRLLKRLNTLFHPGASSGHKHSHSVPTSHGASSVSLSRGPSSSSSRAPRTVPSTPLVSEPEALPSHPPPPHLSTDNVRPSLKIRICTFNMHDSLPSSEGDLSEFLGDVKAFPQQFAKKPKKRLSSHSSFGGRSSSRGSVLTVPLDGEVGQRLPKFPLNEGHPYHVVVVCGQECPTASGVFAGKVRTLDGKGWTSILENYLCGGCAHDSDSDSCSSSSSDEDEDAGSVAPSSPPELSSSPDNNPSAEGGSMLSRSTTAQSFNRRLTDDERSSRGSHGRGHSGRLRGPYVLIEKERLLGIYCAVFVARSCEDFVEGVSKGRVTAGLIGGRVGNKGGVGISLHFASSRLLFISAHLAAHASGLEIRKANALKILEEMDVDDFWEASGKAGPKPREVTERFDQTFFMGDLNFRLAISRLHCDWILRAKDYTTALKFDQLREVLAEAEGVFKGFSEGAITFGPTYKFDIPRSVKKKRSTILGRRGNKRNSRDLSKSPVLDHSISEAEAASASGSLTDPEVSHSTVRDDDALSVISSAGTVSTMDISGFDPAIERGGMGKAELSSLGLPTPPQKGNETSMDAVRKAQVRFLTLVRSNSAAAAIAHAQEKAKSKEAKDKRSSGTLTAPTTPRLQSLFPPRPILQASQSAIALPTTDGATTPNSGESTDREDAPAVPAEPVFDTSAKQRVQSYTDRILFKSTVPVPPPSEPPTPEIEREQESGFDMRARRSTGFTNALRSLTRHSSSSSSDDDEPRRPTSADGSRHLRFGDVFSRPRFKSLSTESVPALADEAEALSSSRSSRALPRTKSLQPVPLSRRGSNADSARTSGSTETHSAPSFWKKVRSLKDLTTLQTHGGGTGSAPSSITSPLDSPSLSTALSTPTTPTFPSAALNPPHAGDPHATVRRTPRKKFTLSSPPSSPDNSRPTSPAAPPLLTRPPFSRPPSDSHAADSSLSPTDPSGPHISFPNVLPHGDTSVPSSNTAHDHSASSASLNTRFKSFLNLLPLPFLNTSTRTLASDAADRLRLATADARRRRVPKVGPRRGEVEVIKYDSVNDLQKMGAVSDHRPVVAVLAVGLGEPQEEEDDGEREV
ncbi:hypothetical protein JCM10207_003683 [Rhodosporidiobolus poonsookiae]